MTVDAVVEERHAPSTWWVIRAIARREISIALRRRLVKLLFIISLGPPIVLGVVYVIQVMVQQAGMDLDWDPVLTFLRVEIGFVTLLALGLGTPSVARDRSEDVLFLYATRPVTPWSYAIGKMLAVGAPALALLLIPAILIAILRQGVMGQEITTTDSLLLMGRVLITSVFVAWGFSGVTVGPSAATKRGRWALLIALAFFFVPDAIVQPLSHLAWRTSVPLLSPAGAGEELLSALFGEDVSGGGFASAVILLA